MSDARHAVMWELICQLPSLVTRTVFTAGRDSRRLLSEQQQEVALWLWSIKQQKTGKTVHRCFPKPKMTFLNVLSLDVRILLFNVIRKKGFKDEKWILFGCILSQGNCTTVLHLPFYVQVVIPCTQLRLLPSWCITSLKLSYFSTLG